MRSLRLLIVVVLSGVALWRTAGFSPENIGAVSVKGEFQETYQYLNKGRQSFVFVSEDGKSVIKFFNQKYLALPWYGRLPFIRNIEMPKRALRKDFYEKSYKIAAELKEAGILNLHLKPTTDPLPVIRIKDRASRTFLIDLQKTPFLLQKRGEPFASGLQKLFENEGIEGLYRVIDQYTDYLAQRIGKRIGDADHDVENNFGLADGVLLHIDPGRLYQNGELEEFEGIEMEWWNGTHRFRDWLEMHFPEEVVIYLDRTSSKIKPPRE